MKNIWLIGCSSGIGFELLKLFLQNNFNIIASSRNAQENEELINLEKKYKNLMLLNIDVSDTKNVESSSKKAFKLLDNIDLVFFNAAVYEVMKEDKWNIKQFESMANINYLGAVRTINSIKPFFYNQGFGRCIFNASLSSYFGLPYGSAYSASKAALLNFAQSIQPELLEKNIEIQIVNHGFVKTRLTSKNDFEMPQLMSAKFAAKQIFDGLQKPYSFEISFPFKLSFFLKLLACLPYKVSLAITKRFL